MVTPLSFFSEKCKWVLFFVFPIRTFLWPSLPFLSEKIFLTLILFFPLNFYCPCDSGIKEKQGGEAKLMRNYGDGIGIQEEQTYGWKNRYIFTTANTLQPYNLHWKSGYAMYSQNGTGNLAITIFIKDNAYRREPILHAPTRTGQWPKRWLWKYLRGFVTYGFTGSTVYNLGQSQSVES